MHATVATWPAPARVPFRLLVARPAHKCLSAGEHRPTRVTVHGPCIRYQDVLADSQSAPADIVRDLPTS